MGVNLKPIGSRICQKRKELSLTQKDLANLINTSNNHLSNIETGKSAPSFATFLEICEVLHTNPDYFIAGTIYSDLDEEIIEQIKHCSVEDKLKLSKIIEIFANK